MPKKITNKKKMWFFKKKENEIAQLKLAIKELKSEMKNLPKNDASKFEEGERKFLELINDGLRMEYKNNSIIYYNGNGCCFTRNYNDKRIYLERNFCDNFLFIFDGKCDEITDFLREIVCKYLKISDYEINMF